MQRLLQRLGDLVASRPAGVVVVTLLVTVLLGALSSQARDIDNSLSASAPSSDVLAAAQELDERFGDDSTLALQLLVTAPPDGPEQPVLSAAGLAAAVRAEEVVRAELGDVLLQGGERPEVLSYATPVLRAAQAQGRDPSTLDDAAVAQLYDQALALLPAEQAERVQGLLGDGGRSASTGLMLVTIDAAAYAQAPDPSRAASDDELAFAEVLAEQDLAFDVLPFSFELLQADDGTFLREIARLFGLAIVVVLIVLAGVLRARRGPVLGLPGAVRRTAADVGLGLAVVVLANVWLRGMQVALGPDGLGIVGPPTPPTNIASILLIALGVDYAIHLSSRYREELGAGASPQDGVRGASRSVGTALLLGALTTGVGFLANLSSPLPPIRDLGVLAAVGLLAAFVITTTFVPAVRLLLDRRADAKGRLVRDEVAPSSSQALPRIALRMGTPALRWPVAVMVVGGLVTAGAALAATRLDSEFDIAAFLPEGSDKARAYELINGEFAGGLGEQTEVLLTGDAVLTTPAHNAQVRAWDALAGSSAVVTNAGSPVGASVVSAVRGVLTAAAAPDAPAPMVQAVDAAVEVGLQRDGTIRGQADEVYAALAPLGVLDGVLDTDAAVPAARMAVSTQTTRVGVGVVITEFEQALAPVEAAGPEVVTTGTLIINDDAITALKSSQITGLLMALVVVLGLLTVVYGLRFGRWEFGLLLMIPVAAVAVWTLGLMALTGIPFDPVTATISALVIGVGIDFTIHLGERFMEDLKGGQVDPTTALQDSLRHTGSALAGSGLTTVLGFAVLTTGSLIPFQRLGTVTVYAVGLSLLAVDVLQPAILLAWARRRHSNADLRGDRAEPELVA